MISYFFHQAVMKNGDGDDDVLNQGVDYLYSQRKEVTNIHTTYRIYF